MESKRKQMKLELVSCERRLQKLINKTTFKHCIRYSDNLNAVELENKIIKFDKPIYIGKYTLNYLLLIYFINIFIFYRIFSIGYIENDDVRLSLQRNAKALW